MNSIDNSAAEPNMVAATASLAEALTRLQTVVASNKAGEEITSLQQEVKEVRAQCAVLIKENAELNAALEEAKQAESEMANQQERVTGRLDSAIDQIQGLLKTG